MGLKGCLAPCLLMLVCGDGDRFFITATVSAWHLSIGCSVLRR